MADQEEELLAPPAFATSSGPPPADGPLDPAFQSDQLCETVIVEHISESPAQTTPLESISLSEHSQLDGRSAKDGCQEGLSDGHPSLEQSLDADAQPSTSSTSITSPTPSSETNPDLRRGAVNSRRSSSDTHMSVHMTGVNWDELSKSEEQEARQDSSDESTALLLARLEQENDALVTDPKSGLSSRSAKRLVQHPRQLRPPSIHQLKSLLTAPTPPALRYSLLPAPPPMTDLEFYAALVADYPRTAQYLPTLLSKKIRSGIPPPLRGVVWASMAGARDKLLEEQYERLLGEPTPYENIIGKDIGRSFPTIEMFREPGGEGQRMLANVLKCFSLYDQKIGYCQGLGFLVGPLLMHMADKQAFCVLVRLMEHYDLRACFLPDLSGLHLRIYQFRHLLTQYLPTLAAHLESLQINPTYASQWFLSLFAVTCPLPMLLRIYDVIFAEGASETLMRVALSLMRRNQTKLMACSELEDVMQLLLSRGIWDVYGYDANAFVNDFVDLTSAVAQDNLLKLEASFKEAKKEGAHAKIGSLPDLHAATSRFLGRFWAGSGSSTKSTLLGPNLAGPSRPTSFLYRSPSKQSMASTLNSFEAGSDSGVSATTDLTNMSRQTSADCTPPKSNVTISTSTIQPSKHGRSSERDLHGQIEDLLIALSNMQKRQVIIGAELQRERDGRTADRELVKELIVCLRSAEDINEMQTSSTDLPRAEPESEQAPAVEKDGLVQLINTVDQRFLHINDSQEAPTSPDPNLQFELDGLRIQYSHEISKSQALAIRLGERDLEVSNLGDQLREARTRIKDGHKERQRLEALLQELRYRRPSEPRGTTGPSALRGNLESGGRRSSAVNGLREFRLNKAALMTGQPPPSFSRRTSSLSTQAMMAAPAGRSAPSSPSMPPSERVPPALNSPPPDAQPLYTPPAQDETLLQELVKSKTAEALAKQEVEELRSKLESLRKLTRVSESQPVVTGATAATVSHPQPEPGATRNLFSSFKNHATQPTKVESLSSASASSTTTSTGGFWGGWGK